MREQREQREQGPKGGATMNQKTLFDMLGPATNEALPTHGDDMPNFQTLYDVLVWCAPPIWIIEKLQAARTKRPGALPDDVLAWLDRWERIRRPEPMPELDGRRFA